MKLPPFEIAFTRENCRCKRRIPTAEEESLEAESRRTKYSFNYARKTLLSAITIYGILNRVRGVRLWCCGLVAEWKAISACTSRDTFLFPGPRNRAFPDLPSDRNGRLVAIYLRDHSPRSFYLRRPRCIPSRFTSPFDLPLCRSGIFVAVLKISRCIDSDVHGDSELIRSLKSVSILNETSAGGEEVKGARGKIFSKYKYEESGKKLLGWRTTGWAKGQKIPSASIPRGTSSDHPRLRDIILSINEFLHLRLNFLDRPRYLTTFHSIRPENDERVRSVYLRGFDSSSLIVKMLITGGRRSMRKRSSRANLNSSGRPPTKEQ